MIYYKTQFEIECRTCGQNMGDFRFFNGGGKKYAIVCHSWFWCAFYETYKKIENFFSKITFFISFSFSFQPTLHSGRVSRGRVSSCWVIPCKNKKNKGHHQKVPFLWRNKKGLFKKMHIEKFILLLWDVTNSINTLNFTIFRFTHCV